MSWIRCLFGSLATLLVLAPAAGAATAPVALAPADGTRQVFNKASGSVHFVVDARGGYTHVVIARAPTLDANGCLIYGVDSSATNPATGTQRYRDHPHAALDAGTYYWQPVNPNDSGSVPCTTHGEVRSFTLADPDRVTPVAPAPVTPVEPDPDTWVESDPVTPVARPWPKMVTRRAKAPKHHRGEAWRTRHPKLFSVEGGGCRTVKRTAEVDWGTPGKLKLLYPAVGSTLQDKTGRPVAEVVEVADNRQWAFKMNVTLKGLDCLAGRWSTAARQLTVTFREKDAEGPYTPITAFDRQSDAAEQAADRASDDKARGVSGAHGGASHCQWSFGNTWDCHARIIVGDVADDPLTCRAMLRIVFAGDHSTRIVGERYRTGWNCRYGLG